MSSADSAPADTAAATDADEAMPRPLPAMWRLMRLGWRVEPRLLALSLGMTLLTMLPDAVLALWLKLLTEGIVDGDRGRIYTASAGLAGSATLTWYLSVVNDRVSRRFRDRLAMHVEGHIALLQASVPTIEHQERPAYLDRLALLRIGYVAGCGEAADLVGQRGQRVTVAQVVDRDRGARGRQPSCVRGAHALGGAGDQCDPAAQIRAHITAPELTLTTSPVLKVASQIRNSTQRATSAGVVSRRSGNVCR